MVYRGHSNSFPASRSGKFFGWGQPKSQLGWCRTAPCWRLWRDRRSAGFLDPWAQAVKRRSEAQSDGRKPLPEGKEPKGSETNKRSCTSWEFSDGASRNRIRAPLLGPLVSTGGEKSLIAFAGLGTLAPTFCNNSAG